MNTLTIENTTYCGGNCIMCVRDKFSYPLGNMSQDLFEKAVKQVCAYSSEMDGGGVD